MTLEWLLVLAAAGGFAAATAFAVNSIAHGRADVPADPVVRVLDADIAAARVAARAQALFEQDREACYKDADGNPQECTAAIDPDEGHWGTVYTDVGTDGFEQDCADVASRFRDVISGNAVWTHPTDADVSDNPRDRDGETSARCTVTPKANLLN